MNPSEETFRAAAKIFSGGISKETKEKMCCVAAKIYAGTNWHRLSEDEEELVSLLEKGGYLTPADQGFVGKTIKE